jgi:Tfp pilus assembly protein PilO
MANFSELSGIKQWGAVILGGAIVTAALYFTVFKSQNEKNAAAQHALEDKIRENNELESYRPKLKQIEQQLAELKQQLEIEQRIVPDEKKVDGFITMLDAKRRKRVWNCGAIGQGHSSAAVLHRGSLRYRGGRTVLFDAGLL